MRRILRSIVQKARRGDPEAAELAQYLQRRRKAQGGGAFRLEISMDNDFRPDSETYQDIPEFQFTAQQNGDFDIDVRLAISRYSGLIRDKAWSRITHEGTAIMEQETYHRLVNYGSAVASMRRMISLQAGEVLKVQVRNDDNTRKQEVKAAGSIMIVERIQ